MHSHIPSSESWNVLGSNHSDLTQSKIPADRMAPSLPCTQASLKPAVCVLLLPALLQDLLTAPTFPENYLSAVLSRQISACIIGLPTCDPR